MELQKINKQNVSDMVYQRLEQCILEKQWLPGEKIPGENALAQQMGVSRVTVRSALQRLSSMGLIEARQGDGTYVKKQEEGETLQLLRPYLLQTRPDVKYFLEYRLAIEPEIAAMAAERVTPQKLELICRSLSHYLDAVKDGNPEAIRFYDFQLHYAIAVASENPLIILIYDICKELYSSNLSQIVTDVGTEAGTQYHRKIVDAISLGNSADARTYMRKHLEETVRLYRRKNP